MSGSVIGIDPSVDHPAFAIWPACETWQLKTTGRGSDRLTDLFYLVQRWTEMNAPADLKAIFIERPTGQFPNPALAQANGVIQVAITTHECWNFEPTCFEVSPGEWKKEALGNGAAKKQDVMEWFAARLREIDYGGEYPPPRYCTQDEADALAIACAGHKLLGRGEAA